MYIAVYLYLWLGKITRVHSVYVPGRRYGKSFEAQCQAAAEAPKPGKYKCWLPVDSNSYIGKEILDILGQKQFVSMGEVFKSLGNVFSSFGAFKVI